MYRRDCELSSRPIGQHARLLRSRPSDQSPPICYIFSVFFDYRSISAVKSNKFDLPISRFVMIKCIDFSWKIGNF